MNPRHFFVPVGVYLKTMADIEEARLGKIGSDKLQAGGKPSIEAGGDEHVGPQVDVRTPEVAEQFGI